MISYSVTPNATFEYISDSIFPSAFPPHFPQLLARQLSVKGEGNVRVILKEQKPDEREYHVVQLI